MADEPPVNMWDRYAAAPSEAAAPTRAATPDDPPPPEPPPPTHWTMANRPPGRFVHVPLTVKMSVADAPVEAGLPLASRCSQPAPST